MHETTPLETKSAGRQFLSSNIAEGFERSGTAEFNQFLATAKGSAGEVRAQLYVALDQGYLEHDLFDRLTFLQK